MSGCVSGVVIVAPCVDHFIEVQDDGAAVDCGSPYCGEARESKQGMFG